MLATGNHAANDTNPRGAYQVVHVWDFYSKQVSRTVAFMGDAPHKVMNAAKIAGDPSAKSKRQAMAVLKQYYGANFMQRLGLDVAAGDDSSHALHHGGNTEEAVILTDGDLAAFTLQREMVKEGREGRERREKRKVIKPQPKKPATRWSASPFSIWPFDKLSEVRDKIYAATGIPPYRQHIFCDNTDYIMYRIVLHGLYVVNIRDTSGLQNVAGMPIDRYMVENKEAIRVEVFDAFKMADSLSWPLYVVDLNDIIERNKTQLEDAMHDSYQRQMIYYGFIIKYWPMLCFQCFADYIDNEEDFLLKYPGFYRPLDTLLPALKKEAVLLRSLATQEKHRTVLPISVTRLAADVKCPLYSVSLRALFDRFVLSAECPAICMYSDYQGGKYLVRKTFARQTVRFPSFPTGKRMIPMVVIAVNGQITGGSCLGCRKGQTDSQQALGQQPFVFVSVYENGSCHLKTEWNEDQQMQITQLVSFLKTTVNPVIDKINVAGAHLEKITKDNIVFKGMTVALYWKRSLSTKNFRVAVDCWSDYIAAGILAPHGLNTSEKVEFLFKKFMVNFDPVAVEKILRASNDIFITNFYSYLSVGIIQTKWSQHYEGRRMAMVHRATDIKFEIADVHETEFPMFYQCMADFCKSADVILDKMPQPKTVATQKLRALKETDPVLFNFVAIERSVKSVNTYSVACQKPMQPIIHDREVPRSTKYWNFSANNPAYYTCPNPKYPRFGFIKDIHPEHFCVPCCYKAPSSHESRKKAQSAAYCLKYKRQPGAKESPLLTHVLDYGKAIDPGRHTRLPPALYRLLGESPQYTLLGVSQHLPTLRNVGILFAIGTALETPVESLLTHWAAELPKYFHMLLNGSIWDHYASPELLSNDLLALAAGKQVAGVWFDRWQSLFVDLANMISQHTVLHLVDPRGDGQVSLITSPILQLINAESKILVALQVGSNKPTPGNIYLLVRSHDDQITGHFHHDDCTAAFSKLIAANPIRKMKSKTVDYDLLIALCKNRGQIDLIYVNLTGWCYAVLLTLDGKQVYCPVRYEPVSATNILTTSKAYMGDPQIQRTTAEWFVGELQKQIETTGDTYADCPTVTSPFGFLCNNKGIIYCDMGAQHPTGYDPKLITAAILTRAPPTQDKTTETPRALYEVYQYQLFLQETVRYLSRSMNLELREKLVEVLRVKKMDLEFRASLKKLLADYPADLKEVWLIIDSVVRQSGSTDLTKANFGPALQRVRFGFDRELLGRINKMPVEEATQTLLTLTANYIVRNSSVVIRDFPNIRSCCATMTPKPNYCDGDKLIITGDLEAFCELAVVDLRNPIKSRYLFDISDVVVTSYFDFVKRPEESIEIIKLGIY